MTGTNKLQTPSESAPAGIDAWCAVAAGTTGAAIGEAARADAVHGAARVLAAADASAARALQWNTPLLPIDAVLLDAARTGATP